MITLGADGAKSKQHESLSFETRFAHSHSAFNKCPYYLLFARHCARY